MITGLCKCFPIQSNKVFMMSYYGRAYNCNPKYITEYLKHNTPYKDLDIVWAFNDVEAHKHIKGIRKVHRYSIKYFYELYTSKIIITNFRMLETFKKRKNQYYIQTWHSSLRLKKVEGDAQDYLKKDYLEMAKKDAAQCDLMLSGCKFSTDTFKRAFFYNGAVLECGTPRNDELVHLDTHKIGEIKERLSIPLESRVLLYAPTFRENRSIESYTLDFDKIRKCCQKKWGGDWTILVRLHPHLEHLCSELNTLSSVRNVTSFEDVQELLLVADTLISDYSSLIFDYLLTKKPCFLYVPDLTEYIQKERSLYFKPQELPFEIIHNKEEITSKFEQFDFNQYKEKIKTFNKCIQSYEEGEACLKVGEYIRAKVGAL